MNEKDYPYLSQFNASYIDSLLEQYERDPYSLDDTWRFFFDGIHFGSEEVVHATQSQESSAIVKASKLVEAYRRYGKHLAHINPLSPPPENHPSLELQRLELSEEDLDIVVPANPLTGPEPKTLLDVLSELKQKYCGTIAVEAAHIENTEVREWVYKRVESRQLKLDSETKKYIHKRLCQSESFERFLHTRYVAQKRFSIEGGEGLIPTLDQIIEKSSTLGTKELVIGMAHRGRLNTLTHILGKKPEYIFSEFEGKMADVRGQFEGDVKYHLGYSSDIKTRSGNPMHLSLGFNPSHLEFINPVLTGKARAKQDKLNDKDGTAVLPLLIHGDAAFAGQGVCYETLNMCGLDGYKVGGTIHIVLNNQIGYTTLPKDSRSTPYCTDLAKMVGAPIFHANGDDPESLWFLADLAAEFRNTFHRDVFIDIVCYRRYGHNEGDEPSFTQPILYQEIKSHKTPRQVYENRLVSEAILSEAQAESIVEAIMDELGEAQTNARSGENPPEISAFEAKWKGLRSGFETDLGEPVKTAISEEKAKDLWKKISTTPTGFEINPKIARGIQSQSDAIAKGEGLDWAAGELLSFASLVDEGHNVRLSGQDVQRGTFGHRHSILHDVKNGSEYNRLSEVSKQAIYTPYNSHLSESGVLGFEFGYSLEDPHSLVIWEAQFGDFANGAQVIIDQFISSTESKWKRMSGIVLLLPHGYEGQGPEHSSCRIERFLQMCGKYNMIVCNFTTPAQLFHGLRRQMKWNFRKPLVVAAPKSLLRHPLATSSLSDITSGKFEEVIDETENPSAVRRVLFCSGKVYYDLLEKKVEKKADDIVIVRIEQLYPWPIGRLHEILLKYPKAQLAWVQEEPRNMGAWYYIAGMENMGDKEWGNLFENRPLRYIGREPGASPAVGSGKIHKKEQEKIVSDAFGDWK